MTETAKSIFDKWRITHKWNSKFEPIDAFYVRDKPLVIFYEKGSEYPWSIQYCGNGVYFKSVHNVNMYIQTKYDKRYFVPYPG